MGSARGGHVRCRGDDGRLDDGLHPRRGPGHDDDGPLRQSRAVHAPLGRHHRRHRKGRGHDRAQPRHHALLRPHRRKDRPRGAAGVPAARRAADVQLHGHRRRRVDERHGRVFELGRRFRGGGGGVRGGPRRRLRAARAPHRAQRRGHEPRRPRHRARRLARRARRARAWARDFERASFEVRHRRQRPKRRPPRRQARPGPRRARRLDAREVRRQDRRRGYL
mmetsp:Transcript_3857/g.11829  ORF Transcript_3857/g.11829 Transcript_3857/m.11829 type:complete len:222 (+) Transcript_3857:586-1251(+)